ncbi:hypothetical protein GGR56DRAFT_465578 [Xylariaceae sp. FL0804]|nr:hypothetical protein GGR56DRAFT_465578 [Xylariaceae sp. FL0804]
MLCPRFSIGCPSRSDVYDLPVWLAPFWDPVTILEKMIRVGASPNGCMEWYWPTISNQGTEISEEEGDVCTILLGLKRSRDILKSRPFYAPRELDNDGCSELPAEVERIKHIDGLIELLQERGAEERQWAWDDAPYPPRTPDDEAKALSKSSLRAPSDLATISENNSIQNPAKPAVAQEGARRSELKEGHSTCTHQLYHVLRRWTEWCRH